MTFKPIGDYGIIGNMLSAALVGVDGSIDWCCLPRFDSPSVFAAILDDEKGGCFGINPQDSYKSHQAYIPNTNVLQTTFQTGTGTATVTDFMPCYRNSQGRLIKLNEIHRQVECADGEVALEVSFEPKLDYARADTQLTISKNGAAARAGEQLLVLSSSVPITLDGSRVTGQFTLKPGQQAVFVLRYGSDKPLSIGLYHTGRKLEQTNAYWQKQAGDCICPGLWREPIVRSYLTLHLLVYAATGAIIAAPTTSLPERIGGERNWDYRFTWLRDASMTLNAFFRLGHQEEALSFFKWLVDVCGKCGPETQILHNIDFADPPQEQKLEHLSGYRGSRPVRIGNDAYKQIQLDVFGEVLDAACYFAEMGGYIGHHTWGLLDSFIQAACDNWDMPDSGIWEVRGGLYHFVHSKLMCWVAVDRGIKIAEQMGYTENIERWRKAAEDIRESILTKGWNQERGAFTQHYDTQALDASNLFMPLFGFIPVTDERFLSTLEHTVEELGSDGLLRRYKTEETDDGLSGSEGAFLWCSFWLVRNYIRLGRLDEATALYEKLLGYRNHLGLLAEMVEPGSGEALGNFPQALTHLAIIITGQELNQALQEEKA